LLSIISLGYLKNDRRIVALRQGRKIVQVFSELFQPLGNPEIVLNRLLNGNVFSEKLLLNVLRFADKDQDITPLLNKYHSQNGYHPTIIVAAALEVIEESLGIKWGNNADDNIKIIETFVKRLNCRSFHGTRSNLAKNILQKGISFSRDDKLFDYDEFEKIVNDCQLEFSHFPFGLNKKRNDIGTFYVANDPANATFYARSNTPEFFLPFKRWAIDEGKNLNLDQFRQRIKADNPKMINIERIINFVQKHWDLCASRKKNCSVLIIEKEIKDCLSGGEPDLLKQFFYYNKGHQNLYDDWGIHAFMYFDKNKVIETLGQMLNENSFEINRALTIENSQYPPRVIHAIKIECI
jgi:hypothetical protein